jgi:type II secretion system protein L
LARKDNTFAILQFDERLISLLRARRSDKGVDVVETERLYGEWPAEGDLQKALKEFVKEHRLAGGPVYTVLPRHEMSARILDLPSQERGEIDNMIRLSAEEYVPFPVEDLVIGQCVLQRREDGNARVFAVFAHKDVVERHARSLREAGIEPERIYSSTTCLASAAAAAHRGGDERYALVNLSSGGIEVLVMNGSRLEYGRGVASHRKGSLRDVPLEDLVEEIGLELRASLSAYRRESEDGEEVERIYLCSEWADPGLLADRLGETSGYRCEAAQGIRALAAGGGEDLAALPAAALGAALAAQGRAMHAVDLEPPSLAGSRAAVSRKRKLMGAGAVLAALLVAAGGYYAQAVYLRTAYIAELTAQADALRPAAESVAEKSRQLRILQSQVDPSGSALEVLSKVMELAPASGLTLVQFTYERGVKADLLGRARSTEEIDQFALALRERGGPLFVDARRGATRSIQEFGRDVVEFAIVVPFPAGAVSEDQQAAADSAGTTEGDAGDKALE